MGRQPLLPVAIEPLAEIEASGSAALHAISGPGIPIRSPRPQSICYPENPFRILLRVLYQHVF